MRFGETYCCLCDHCLVLAEFGAGVVATPSTKSSVQCTFDVLRAPRAPKKPTLTLNQVVDSLTPESHHEYLITP